MLFPIHKPPATYSPIVLALATAIVQNTEISVIREDIQVVIYCIFNVN